MVKTLNLVLCASLALAALAVVPSVSAEGEHDDCVEYFLSYTLGVVCKGTSWCDDSSCAQETCALQVNGRNDACVLSPPDAEPANPYNCLLTPTSKLGLICSPGPDCKLTESSLRLVCVPDGTESLLRL